MRGARPERHALRRTREPLLALHELAKVEPLGDRHRDLEARGRRLERRQEMRHDIGRCERAQICKEAVSYYGGAGDTTQESGDTEQKH